MDDITTHMSGFVTVAVMIFFLNFVVHAGERFADEQSKIISMIGNHKYVKFLSFAFVFGEASHIM